MAAAQLSTRQFGINLFQLATHFPSNATIYKGIVILKEMIVQKAFQKHEWWTRLFYLK